MWSLVVPFSGTRCNTIFVILMTMDINSKQESAIVPDFLARYGKGFAKKTTFLSAGDAFIRVIYDDEGVIQNAAYVKNKEKEPSGMQLYFDWANERVTWKTEVGLSGFMWASGSVTQGSVRGEEEAMGEADSRKIELEPWIDECIEETIKIGERGESE